MDRCTIVIGGDVCPAGMGLPPSCGTGAGLFGDLAQEFGAADFSVVNLECPLTDRDSPIAKSGPVLRAAPGFSGVLKDAGVRAVNLANNHILDHGAQGLAQTIGVCGESGLGVFGAGADLAAAGEPLLREMAGMRVAFLGMAEHEFSIAGRRTPGANPLDPIRFRRFVRSHRDSFDHLVVLLHAGREFYRHPSPELQRTCRFLVEEGASAVLCQHSHCPGTFEHYEGAPIVYGQGNLLFDLGVESEEWRTGYLVRLTLERGRRGAEFAMVPFVQEPGGRGVRKMAPPEAEALRSELAEASRALADEEEVQRLWEELCSTLEAPYLSLLRGHGPLARRINRWLPFARHFYSGRGRAALLGIVRCESHHEVLKTVLRSLHEGGGTGALLPIMKPATTATQVGRGPAASSGHASGQGK